MKPEQCDRAALAMKVAPPAWAGRGLKHPDGP